MVIDEGDAITETFVTVEEAADTAMLAVPETLVNPDCADVAVQLPVPVPEGVKTPACVIVPPVAVHETAEL